MAPVAGQRYSCHGCGNCCRDFTVQLRKEDLRRLKEQNWEARLGESVTMTLRGRAYLKRRADGACVFLQPDGKCRVHAEFGLHGKPVACRFFPFSLSPSSEVSIAGLNFACQSVLESNGAALSTHRADLERLAAEAPETVAPSPMPLLSGALRARPEELEAVVTRCQRWLEAPMSGAGHAPLRPRLEALAWLAQMLNQADLQIVRGGRFRELVETLLEHAPSEIALHPAEAPDRVGLLLLQHFVFARTEDPAMELVAGHGRLRTIWRQLSRSRGFQRATGPVPATQGLPAGATIEAVTGSARLAASPDAEQIDDLFSRWLRARIAGGRAWGSGFYGWSVASGMVALMVDCACAAWLARCHAVSTGRKTVTIEDARFGVGRIDRASGRASWLGLPSEARFQGTLASDDRLRQVLVDQLGEP